MAKTRITNNVFIPMPVALVGANVGGTANFMAVGWITRANFQPPMIAVAINRAHHTTAGVRENGTFSVCFPGADMVEQTDYCGLVSGRNTDKSKVFTVFYGEAETAPMIEECPLCLECRLVESIELPANTLFVGEIAGAYAEDRFLTNNALDYKKIDALILTMPDNAYWRIGDFVAKAWSVGKKLKDTPR